MSLARLHCMINAIVTELQHFLKSGVDVVWNALLNSCESPAIIGRWNWLGAERSRSHRATQTFSNSQCCQPKQTDRPTAILQVGKCCRKGPCMVLATTRYILILANTNANTNKPMENRASEQTNHGKANSANPTPKLSSCFLLLPRQCCTRLEVKFSRN